MFLYVDSNYAGVLKVLKNDKLSYNFDTAWLIISLYDKNDNPPRFVSPYYTATIKEGPCDVSLPLVTLTVIDDDLSQHGPPFKFDFATYGNPGNRFQLRNTKDNKTKLYCSGSFNRESTPDFKVIVKVTDNPTAKDAPKLFSTVNIFVHVLDVDESPESSAALKVIVNAVGDDFAGDRIAKTYFKDDDGDGDVYGMTYSITGIEFFKLSCIF